MKKHRILIATGGTGGHLFPAQALAEELADHEILFIGTGLKRSHFFARRRHRFVEIPSSSLSLRRPFKSLRGLSKLLWGTIKSLYVLRRFKPDLVVGFGSFHTFPALLAARLRGIPLVLYEPNAIPGRVNRIFARKALFTGVALPRTASRLKGKTHSIAPPLRARAGNTRLKSEEARRKLGLDPDRFTLLIFGGSQGAEALNRIATEAAPQLAPHGLQIIHLTGPSHDAAAIGALYQRLNIPAYVAPFEEEMALPWSSADLVLMRAGASSLAEQLDWEVPAILVPYPFAMDQHQEANARVVADEVGGAFKIHQAELTGDVLAGLVHRLMASNETRTMKAALRAQKQRPLPGLGELVSQYLESR